MKNQKRYAVTLDLYIWVDNAEDARIKADRIAKWQDKLHDNRCKVVSIHDTSGDKPVEIKI